jgi:hypothetical protein
MGTQPLDVSLSVLLPDAEKPGRTQIILQYGAVRGTLEGKMHP